MLGLILEIVIQILIEILGELAFQIGLGSIGHSLRESKKTNPVLAYTGIMLIGSIIGFVASLIFSERIVADPPISGLSFVLSPLLAGISMSLFGKWRREKGHNTSRLATFWGGALFALSFAIVRWIMIEGVI